MNVLSLFDGISCGMVALERAGFEINNYYASEIDWYPRQISQGNYPKIKSLGSVTNWKQWDKAHEFARMHETAREFFLDIHADKMVKGVNELHYKDGGIPWGNWDIDWGSIDLVLAGFPCQAWSMAGQQKGDKDPRGALFWVTLDIIAKVLKCNPNAKFLMENVKMKREFEEYITHHTEEALGYVEKTLINSALVSAQNRNRFYWTNFKVSQPEDKGVLLKDIIEDCGGIFQKPRGFNKGGIVQGGDKAPTLTVNSWQENNFAAFDVVGGALRDRYLVDGKRQDRKMKTAGMTEQRLEVRSDSKTNTLTTVQKDNVVVYRPYNELVNESASKEGKSYALVARYAGAVAWNSIQKKQKTMIPVGLCNEKNPNVYNGVIYRKLTPIECERLQTLPDNYTDFVSNSQRYKAIGNGWTVDVVSHIFKCMR